MHDCVTRGVEDREIGFLQSIEKVGVEEFFNGCLLIGWLLRPFQYSPTLDMIELLGVWLICSTSCLLALFVGNALPAAFDPFPLSSH